MPSTRPRPISVVVVVPPAVAVLVGSATIAGASIGEVDNRDDWPVTPVPVGLVLLGEGGAAGGHEVVIPGTLGYAFLLVAAQGNQMGNQLGSGIHG